MAVEEVGERREMIKEMGDGDGYIFFRTSDNNISYFSAEGEEKRGDKSEKRKRMNARGHERGRGEPT